jgi:pimeloyl-ACP methyl ester carboxylesterase
LVWTSTSDRVRLHGFLIEPANRGLLSIDGCLIVHGLGGNFYSSGLLTFLARQFSARGLPVILVNTRGHDFLNVTTRSGRSQLGGSSLENVAEGDFDIAAWSEYMRLNCGCQRIVVAGHSLGAIKAIHAEAWSPAKTVAAVLAISATRLNFEHFQNGPAREVFLKSFQKAGDFVADGRTNEFVPFDFPFPTWMQPQAYLDKYGPENKYDWVQFIERIAKPMLLTFGQLELEEHPAFAGLEPLTRGLQSKMENLAFARIERADHFYVAAFDALWQSIEEWLNRL